MKIFINVMLMMISCLLITACSDEGSSNAEAKKDHVWKEQTDTINKAKEVEGMLMDSAANTRNALENKE
jgi:outer membrane biogenesis lipoprotein LolB